MAGSLIALIILRILLGIGQSVAFPASARAVANWFQNKERGTVTGAYLTGVRVGQAVVAGIGVSGILAFPPYYPFADNEGMFHYYKSIADVSSLGTLIYARDWLVFELRWLKD